MKSRETFIIDKMEAAAGGKTDDGQECLQLDAVQRCEAVKIMFGGVCWICN